MAAYAPGTAMTATLAGGPRRAADAVVRGRLSAPTRAASRPALRSSSTDASARFATASLIARTDTRRSEGPASGASTGHMPASRSIERPSGVPITTATSATPASCLACSATRMRSIESKYEFRRTAHIKRIRALRSSHYSESVGRGGARPSPQTDHYEPPLLQLIVDVAPLAVAESARSLGPGSRRQDTPVEEDFDVRHPGEDPLEIVEELGAVPGDDHDYPRHRPASSENLPGRLDGRGRRLQKPKDSTVFLNGIANASGLISRGKNELPRTVSTDNSQNNGSPSLSGLALRSPPL